MTSHWFRPIVLGLALAPFFGKAQVQVDPALPAFRPAGALSGTFTAVGDDDMESLMRRWVAIFSRAHPDVEFHLAVESSATAPGILASGTAKASFVGRKMLGPEMALVAKAWGHEAVPVVVSGGTFADKEETHAEAVWVNANNPLPSVTLEQLDAVFGASPRRGAPSPARTWGDLGLTGDWAARPIRALRYKSVGAAEFFRETVLQGGEWGPSVQLLGNVRDVLPIVSKDPAAIGPAGLGFAKSFAVRPLPIAPSRGASPVEPTLENVASFRYPLSRVVYIYMDPARSGPPGAIIREFLRAVLSKEGQAAALEDGYLPLSHETVAAELAKLN